VAADVCKGIISRWTAENVYCVVFADGPAVDQPATLARREAERKRRLEQAKPYGQFIRAWSRLRPPDSSLEFYGEWPACGVSGTPGEPVVRGTPAVGKALGQC